MQIPESRKQLLTTGTKALSSIVTTETIVSSNKGSNYAKVDDLFSELSDLVNEEFRLWYLHQFNRLGADTTLKLAAIARQEAHTNKQRYFSTMLKKS